MTLPQQIQPKIRMSLCRSVGGTDGENKPKAANIRFVEGSHAPMQKAWLWDC
jgi:hypothetical protein